MRTSILAFLFTGMAVTVACGRTVAEDKAKDVVKVATPLGGIVATVTVKEGDRVKPGDDLIRLDGRMAAAIVDIQKVRLGPRSVELKAAESIEKEAHNRYLIQLQLFNKRCMSEEDLRAAALTWKRYQSELASKTAALQVAEAEVALAEVILDMHTVRSPVKGVVQRVLVKPGEGAKELETVVVIRASE